MSQSDAPPKGSTRTLLRFLAIGVVAAGVIYLALWSLSALTGASPFGFGPSQAPILAVYGDPGSNKLVVDVGTCRQDPQVTASESATEIRLSSNEKRVDDGLDCGDSASVVLKEPLGNRAVIDEATDQLLEVRPAG
ncbi:MAG: hypothetical protein HZY75_07820 [Nocardioidaceae bacterium]|nr:MAG: hypothetical protein HZY75_07820 [Nocardioidaceae bacterium]